MDITTRDVGQQHREQLRTFDEAGQFDEFISPMQVSAAHARRHDPRLNCPVLLVPIALTP